MGMKAQIHFDTAVEARSLGLSPLPPKEDGTKAPIAPRYDEEKGRHVWEPLMKAPATDEELRRWYKPSRGNGFTGNGLVMGYGNAECLDFDDRETYLRFVVTAKALGYGDLLERIANGYEEESPSEGVHWVYRCEAIEGSLKLAERPAPTEKGARSTERRLSKRRASAATSSRPRAAGRYIRAGSPTGSSGVGSKRSSRSRRMNAGHSSISAARSMRCPPRAGECKGNGKAAKNPWTIKVAVPGDVPPGDAYEEENTWADILEPLGWTLLYTRGDVGYWRRPGKDQGISATTGHCKGLYVFSTSTPFEPRRSYSKFAVYAHLRHAGDFKAAAKDLASNGYGTPLQAKGKGPSSNGVDCHTNGRYPTYAPGTLLYCKDKDNYGYVVEDLGDMVRLVFRPGEPSEGHATLHKSQVELATGRPHRMAVRVIGRINRRRRPSW